MNQYRPTSVYIHLDRLQRNYKELESWAGSGAFLCPMIKANAYGHGDVACAKALVQGGCENLGVASVEEGLRILDHKISAKVHVFGFSTPGAVDEILNRCLIPVVSDFSQLEMLAENAKNETTIHLKFNTGMNRLGFSVGDLPKIHRLLGEKLKVVGVCTHLHSAEDFGLVEASTSYQQISMFKKIIQEFADKDVFFHVYNSAAISAVLNQSLKLEFGLRPGLLTYGIDPLESPKIKTLISPVMEFKSVIVALQKVKSNEVVSYGGTWQATRDSIVGLIPAGYADGVSRSLSNVGEVLVCQQKVPLIGRVCMDYAMVDLTEVKKDTDSLVGQEVVFFGQQGEQQMSVNDVAKQAGKVSYEILTGISERVPRIYSE